MSNPGQSFSVLRSSSDARRPSITISPPSPETLESLPLLTPNGDSSDSFQSGARRGVSRPRRYIGELINATREVPLMLWERPLKLIHSRRAAKKYEIIHEDILFERPGESMAVPKLEDFSFRPPPQASQWPVDALSEAVETLNLSEGKGSEDLFKISQVGGAKEKFENSEDNLKRKRGNNWKIIDVSLEDDMPSGRAKKARCDFM